MIRAQRRREMVAMVLVLILAGGCTSDSTPDTTTASLDSVTTVTTTPDTTSVEATSVPETTTPPPTTTTSLDTVPPALEVLDPISDGVVTDSKYRFKGLTDPGATLTAAGTYPVPVAVDGSWSIVLVLNPGGNVARFVATDEAGNTTEVRHPVYLNECADEPEHPWPENRSDVTSISGDLDGDGAADSVASFRSKGRWYLAVDLAYGWQTSRDITVWIDPSWRDGDYVSANRMVDLGDPLALLMLNPNSVGRTLGMFGFSGCAVIPILDPSGEMPTFWDGIGGQHGVMVCESNAVLQVMLWRGPNGTDVVLDQQRFFYRQETHSWDPTPRTSEVIISGSNDFSEPAKAYQYCFDET